MKKTIGWILPIVPAVIFLQSLFFKFSGSEETRIIFATIGAWMADLPVISGLASTFSTYGGITVGLVELLAAILLLLPATRRTGAVIGLGVISGAIFFHLATPLGVERVVDAAGNTDGGALFIMACVVWVCCALTLFWRPGQEQTLRQPPETTA